MSNVQVTQFVAVDSPSARAPTDSGRGSVFQFAVVIAFITLAACYIMGVSGNTAILIFIAVIALIVALHILGAIARAGSSTRTAHVQITHPDRSMNVGRLPQAVPITMSQGESVLIEISIKNAV